MLPCAAVANSVLSLQGSSVDLLAGTKLAAGSAPSLYTARASSSGSQVRSHQADSAPGQRMLHSLPLASCLSVLF